MVQDRVRLIWVRRVLFPQLSLNILREVAGFLESEDVPLVACKGEITRWNYKSGNWTTECVLSQTISVGFNSIVVRTDPGEVIVCCAGGDCKGICR